MPATDSPLLDVKGVTLQYKTRDHLVTATYRVDFQVLRCGSLRASRPLGVRQVDFAQGGRRVHASGRGRDPPQGHRGDAARARPHDGVPGVRPAAAMEDGQGERDVRADRQRQARRQARRGAGARIHRQGQSHQVRRQLSAHALGRHEAARRDRARHGDGARRAADGRAVRGARRADPAQDAGRAAAAVGRHAFHGAVRHPLDRGGDQDRQPDPADVAASGAGQGRDQQPAARRGGQRGRQGAGAKHPQHAIRRRGRVEEVIHV